MILEIIALAVVLYVLVVLHKQDLAKGGEGVPIIGEFLEEVDRRIRKFLEDQKKNKKSGRKSAASTSQSSASGEKVVDVPAEPQTQNQQPAAPLEKFESVRPVKHLSKQDKSKQHHHRHRSKLESALVAAQKESGEQRS